MSLEAMTWALNRAPVDESSFAFVLTGLANHAGPDGRNAFPSTARLCAYTRLARSTVQDCLDVLAEAQIILPADPEIVAAHIKRADQRPQGWDLDLTLDIDNPEHLARFHAAVAALKARRKERKEKREQAKAAAEAAAKAAAEAPEPDADVKKSSSPDLREPYGARQSGPVGPVDNSLAESGDSGHGARQSGPAKMITGPDGRQNGARQSAERGPTIGPEPSFEPSFEPSLSRTPVPAVGGLTVGDARAAEAPAAQPNGRQLLRARGVLARIPSYRIGCVPGWVRSKHLLPMTARALAAGFGETAIVRYARLVTDEARYADHQHIPAFREALRRLGRDVALGTACREDGAPAEACPCRDANEAPPADRPWTEADQADWERVLEQFDVGADEPGDEQQGA